MTLQERLKSLRREIGFSQKALGSQGFISGPGWAKLENGQRLPSDKLIMRLISWTIREGYFNVGQAARAMDELLTLKHLSNRSSFVRRLVRAHAEDLFEGTSVRLSDDSAVYRLKPRRKAPRPEAI